MIDRDHVHALRSGDTIEGTAPDGKTVTGRHTYRFAQGLRPDHVAALDARPDLCARLWREGIDPAIHWFAVSAEELDAGIDAMLAETTQ